MSYNMIPDIPRWAAVLVIVVLIIGALTILAGLGALAWWVISHLRWVS